jgi:hypothetical protein
VQRIFFADFSPDDIILPMDTKFRKYQPGDFLPVRDFLAENYQKFAYPVNWDIVRWNYARYFCAPMLGAWGIGEEAEKIPDTGEAKSREAVRFWESSIGIWENRAGAIVGLVCPDEYVPWHPAFGQAFPQRHPDYEFLLREMLAYAEQTFIGKGMTRIYVGAHDLALQETAKERGFIRDEKSCLEYLEFDLSDIPAANLPKGYRFVSMAENNDLEERRKITGLSFNHPDPNDWPTLFSYRELQKAPDYHRELDIVVERPDGKWVACTIAWFDGVNQRGTLEPVGSIQLGMGREVVMEGLRRLQARGAKVARMDSNLKFYKVIGFQERFPIYRWVKQH